MILSLDDFEQWREFGFGGDAVSTIPRELRPSVIHPNREQAEKEAARLCGLELGSRFAVLEVVGIVHSTALQDVDAVKGIGACSALVPRWEETTEI